MADTPNAPHHHDVPTGSASGTETQLFHDIIGRLGSLPPSVRRVEFHFGEDSAGASAVWITLVVGDDDLKPSSEKIASFQRVKNEVWTEILRSDTERWPYVEIVTE